MLADERRRGQRWLPTHRGLRRADAAERPGQPGEARAALCRLRTGGRERQRLLLLRRRFDIQLSNPAERRRFSVRVRDSQLQTRRRDRGYELRELRANVPEHRWTERM